MSPPLKKTKVDQNGNGDNDQSENVGAETSIVASSGDLNDAAEKATTDEDTAAKRTLFVRSLDYSTTSEALTTHFSYAGPIKHATVVVDPTTKTSRGFGFVTFVDAADAQSAIKEFNGKLLGGRHIKVEIAQPRHRDATANGTTPGNADAAKGAAAHGKDVKRRAPRLIVRNLPWSIKKPEELEVHFRMYGKVKNIVIPRKGGKKTGPMSGFAIVTMRNSKNAERAMAGVNGKDIEGRQVAVDWAIEKNEWEKAALGDDDDDDDDEEDGEGGKDEDVSMLDADEEDSYAQDGEEDGSSDDSEDDNEDDYEDIEADDSDMDDEDKESKTRATTAINNFDDSTVFIRNLAFTTEEDTLYEHFSSTFGPVRYARIVMDHATERPKGTAFVCFYNTSDCDECLRDAPKSTISTMNTGGKYGNKQSILQSDDLDPTGKYTLDGRVLSLARAVSKENAEKLTVANSASRDRANRDRRHLYLLQEGTVPSNSPLYAKLSKKEISLREASLKQRKTFVEKNPSLHLSLTRLSVRNIPRNITEKDLKQLARKAIVEFASEVKKGLRQPLSKEELARGGPEMKEEEKRRRAQGKGVVKQAKLVREDKGAGRSKGYGFLEYASHRWALMGLRWLNANEVANVSLTNDGATADKGKGDRQAGKLKKGKGSSFNSDSASAAESFPEDRKRRLIVEFALENVQVVNRRRDKETKARERAKDAVEHKDDGKSISGNRETRNPRNNDKKQHGKRKNDDSTGSHSKGFSSSNKRKRGTNDSGDEGPTGHKINYAAPESSADVKTDKAAKVTRIIARKRQIRRARRKGA